MQESRKRPESPNTNSTSGTSSKKNRSVRTRRSSEVFFYRSQRRREWDSNPRGRDAQRLSCPGPYNLRSRGRRFNHSAIPAWIVIGIPVLNHFRTVEELAKLAKFTLTLVL